MISSLTLALLVMGASGPELTTLPPLSTPLIVGQSRLRLAPLPKGVPISAQYEVAVEGRSLPVLSTNVQADHVNWSWDMKGTPSSLVRLEMQGPIRFRVKSLIPITKVRVLPESLGVTPTVSGQEIRFTLRRPANFILETGPSPADALHVFAERLEVPADRPVGKVLYFGPGLHKVGKIKLSSATKTLYLDAGAVVRGAIEATNLIGVQILGSGILDGSQTERDRDAHNLIRLTGCQSARISGPTLLDNPTWNIVLAGSDGVEVSRTKIIGARPTCDGIDVVHTSDVRIDQCFIRNFDDAVSLKGIEEFRLGKKPIRGIRVTRSTFHNDNGWGGPFSVGYETYADEINGFTIEDCEVTYCSQLLRLLVADPGGVKNVVLRNLTVEMPTPREPLRFVVGRDHFSQWYKNDRQADGSIENVVLENVRFRSRTWADSVIEGRNETAAVRGVRFLSVTLNGRPVSRENAQIKTNAHVQGLEFGSREAR